jgi:hypothetical protein
VDAWADKLTKRRIRRELTTPGIEKFLLSLRRILSVKGGSGFAAAGKSRKSFLAVTRAHETSDHTRRTGNITGCPLVACEDNDRMVIDLLSIAHAATGDPIQLGIKMVGAVEIHWETSRRRKTRDELEV